METIQNNRRPFIEALLCGLAGGAVFSWLGLPLAWMLGPLTAVILWSLFTRRKLYWPKPFKNGGQMLLGYSMGLSFTAESARQITQHLPSMTIITVLLVSFGLVIAYFVAKASGMGLPTAVMGTTPGGLSQMTLLSEEIRGADPAVVTIMQTVRMLTVVFLVPSLSVFALSGDGETATQPAAIATQAWNGEMLQVLAAAAIVAVATALAVRFRFPTPWILGPLISAAVLTVSGFGPPHLPPALSITAQLLIGVYLGLGIKLEMLKNWKRLLPISLISGLLIVGLALALAFVLVRVHPMSVATAFLCIAPGGLPEMGVTAQEIGADVSLVAAYQLYRVFFILFIVPIFLRFAFGRRDELDKTAEAV